MGKFSVIVVGAGSGRRFGGKENKIYAKLDGQHLFLRAVQLFVNREDVCQTILVVSPAESEEMRRRFGATLGFMGVRLVEGGERRFESVANGLAVVSEEAEFVAVHDAVRVCVAAEWIDQIFAAAMKHGAAAPVMPVTSTLKRVGADRRLGETVSREGLHLAQTPQAFRKDILKDAYGRLDVGDGAGPTDDAQVVSDAGHAVMAVPGDARNIKVTTRDDLSLAGAVLKVLPQKQVSRGGAFEEAKW